MVFNTFGGDKRDRTADLLNAIQALSQLSYTPILLSLCFIFCRVPQDFCIITQHLKMSSIIFSFFKIISFDANAGILMDLGLSFFVCIVYNKYDSFTFSSANEMTILSEVILCLYQRFF